MVRPDRAWLNWTKATGSGSTECLETAHEDDHVLVRDSKDPAGPVLAFRKASWLAFLRDVRSARISSDASR